MLIEQKKTVEGGVSCIEISDPVALPSKPTVSVKMITYNHATYIADAIEGVLSQETDFPIELVVGEDCSTDNTMKIVRSYAEKHPDVIRIATSSSNVGSKENSWRTEFLCRGEFLAFCEGDDYWHDTTKLSKQVEILKADSNCVLVHTDVDKVFVEGRSRIGRYQYRMNRNYQKAVSMEENFARILANETKIITPTVCLRAKTLRAVVSANPQLFLRSTYPMGDTPRWLELAMKGAFRYIDEPTAVFRRLPESASRSNDMNRLAQFTIKGIELRRYFAAKYPQAVDTAKFNSALRRMGARAIRRACLADNLDAIRQISDLMPRSALCERLLSFFARNSVIRSVYRSIDGVFFWIYRKARRLKYDV